jgi:hypothetical protein
MRVLNLRLSTAIRFVPRPSMPLSSRPTIFAHLELSPGVPGDRRQGHGVKRVASRQRMRSDKNLANRLQDVAGGLSADFQDDMIDADLGKEVYRQELD